MKTTLETLNDNVLNETNGGCANPPAGFEWICSFFGYQF